MTPAISFVDNVVLVTAAGIGLARADAGLPPTGDRRTQT
jgi:hypothetical protein